MNYDLPKMLEIDHIIDRVYISGWRATLYADYLRQAEITNILKLYPNIPCFPPDFNSLELGIDETEVISDNTIRRGVEFVLEQVNAKRPVLIMCYRGINRSSTFALAYLLEKGYEPREALAFLRERHNQATPHPLMWRSLIDHYQLPCTVDDALVWMRRS
jgi:protein-tyrosine phosphatase